MRRAIDTLNSGDYSCVVLNGDELRTFTDRGVADLYRLHQEEREFLRGAMIADKVVGKGAAALMVSGGVKSVYSQIISCGALEILEQSDINVEYDKVVPHIINRDKSDWCPIEKLCRESSCVAEIIVIVDKFIKRLEQ